MKNSNLSPKIYTLSAMILGYAMIGDYTVNEQNAIGNWFMLIGQILESNSAIEQALQGNNTNMNYNFPPPSREEINEIKEVINNLLDKISKMENI